MSKKSSIHHPVNRLRAEASEHVERAVKDVAQVCGVDQELIFSRIRPEHVCICRFFIYTIMRNMGHTWTYIGEFMGRDHGAAVMGARRLHRRLACREKHLMAMRDELRKRGWKIDDDYHNNFISDNSNIKTTLTFK